MKSGFKRTINCNKYRSKITIEREYQYFDHLIDPGFQEINKSFVLSFENNLHQISQNRYYFPTVETKDYNVMINEQNFIDLTVKNGHYEKNFESFIKFYGRL